MIKSIGSDYWIEHLESLGALWRHDGNPNRPYAKLTSGLHSDGFVNMTKLGEYPKSLRGMCEELVVKFGNRAGFPSREEDYMVGSAMGSIVIAHELAWQRRCKTIYAEKDGESMKFKRFSPTMSSVAILVEDVISTGGTTLKTREECLNHKLIVPDFVLCLVNRSGQNKIGDLDIISVLDLNIKSWEPKDGEKAVRPKENWKELTRNYS